MSAVRRAALLAALLGPVAPHAVRAQQPAVSAALPAAWHRDTVFTVWLFARPGAPLDSVAIRAARAGARVRTRSRWLHAVSAAAPAAALRTLAQDRDLRRIQPLGRWRRRAAPADTLPLPFAITAADDTCGPTADPVYGPSAMPYRQLNLIALAEQGFAGAGVRIALLDTGFDTADPAFAGVVVDAQRDFVFADGVVRDEPADQPGAHGHGTAVWSLLAGDVPGRLRGVARDAAYLLAKTEDVRSETRIEEDHFVAALEWADSLGADLASASLGYLSFDNGFGYLPSELNGDVAVTTVAVDSAAARGLLVLSAAGNGGPGFRTLVTPADADSGLAIGAEDSLGSVAGFSSRGPTADGRLKPDLTAPGAAVCAVTGGGTVRRLNGTSFATPLVAAATALLRQAHPTLRAAGLAAALRRHAANRAAPDSVRGHGRPDVTASVVFPIGVVAHAPPPGPIATVTPTFDWTAGVTPAFASPVRSRLRVAADSALAAPLVDTTLDATSATVTRALPPGPVWWHVDATAATGQRASSGPAGPVTVPPWATLRTLSAPAGETTLDSQPTLRWSSPQVAAPPGPFRYDVFIQRTAASIPDVVITDLADTALLVPQPLERNVTYRWGVVSRLGPDSSVTRSAGTFLVLDPSVPPTTLLYQNFPNPFPGPAGEPTCVWFDLATVSLVQLEILDLRGRRVRSLIPAPGVGGVLPPGRYGRGAAGTATCDPRFAWDGRADDGRPVPAGVYLCRLRTSATVQFKRIVYRGGGP